MIKQISMMKRHPGLTVEQFITRYESVHAKFGDKLFSRSKRFVRRYVQPLRNPLTGKLGELDFDVIIEIWWETREAYEADMKGLAQSDLLPAVRESGATLFASHDNPAFTVVEYDSDFGTDWSYLSSGPVAATP